MFMKRLLLWCILLSAAGVSWGQKKFESPLLQQAAASLSDENPCITEVYQFAESYFNRLLSISPQERVWRMAADNVTIETGKLENLSLVNRQTSLQMMVQDTKGVLAIMNDDFPLIRISFPMSYQLVRQKNQKELEELLVKELKTKKTLDSSAWKSRMVDRSLLQRTAPGLFVDKGNTYYMDAINNHLYYHEDKKKGLVLACSVDYLLESVSNLLLEAHEGLSIVLDMKVHRYGFHTDSLQVDLNQWIAYCKNSGCELFVGIKNMDKQGVNAAVFAVNSCFFYNHVLNVHFPIEVLDNKRGELKADAYVFIPTHNLSDLFEEMNFVNKKTVK